jgi:hypothetical protein
MADLHLTDPSHPQLIILPNSIVQVDDEARVEYSLEIQQVKISLKQEAILVMKLFVELTGVDGS